MLGLPLQKLRYDGIIDHHGRFTRQGEKIVSDQHAPLSIRLPSHHPLEFRSSSARCMNRGSQSATLLKLAIVIGLCQTTASQVLSQWALVSWNPTRHLLVDPTPVVASTSR